MGQSYTQFGHSQPAGWNRSLHLFHHAEERNSPCGNQPSNLIRLYHRKYLSIRRLLFLDCH